MIKQFGLFSLLFLLINCSSKPSAPEYEDSISILVPPTKTRTPSMVSDRSVDDFYDSDLEQILRKESKGLIFIASPQMPLSVLSLDHIESVAKKRNLPLTILMEPQGSETFIRFRRNLSDRLVQVGANLHYPVLVIYRGGQLITRDFYGAKSALAYDRFIQETLAAPATQELEHPRLPESLVDKTREPSPWKEVRRVRIKGIPGYYFKPLAGGKWVAYTKRPFMVNPESKHDLATALLMKNHLLNLETGEEIEMEGQVDPVPTPDEKIVSHPHFLGDYRLRKFSEHSFYSVAALQRGVSPKKALIKRDKTVPGTYQSFGLLKNSQGQTVYRMVAETVFEQLTVSSFIDQDSPRSESFFIQEYVLRESSRKLELLPKFSKPTPLCPAQLFSLPMISKTGLLLAAVDPYTREAKVMKIGEKGQCQDLVNIGIPTGKVDFAYDDNEVTFHISWTHSTEPNRTYLNIPKARHNMDVMTYDLRTRELRRVTQCRARNANCYYPAFTKAGELVYLEQNRETQEYDFVVLKK